MAARSRTHAASSSDGDDDGEDTGEHTAGQSGGEFTGVDDGILLAALLDGMDAALCAFDANGVVTHWNGEAERILGWTAQEAVGRKGLAGWAVRAADAEDIEARLLGAMDATGRQVHEFALLTKDGGRVLVRTQSSAVTDEEGRPAGVYCAFSEVHAQIDLERSIALSEALFEDASWGVVLVDADLRPAVVNRHAAKAFRVSRSGLLGRPLGELVDQGLEDLEGALQHVLAEGAPPAPAELWLTLRTDVPDSDREERPDGGGDRRAESPGDSRQGHGGAASGQWPPASGPQGTASSRGGPAGADSAGTDRRCWRSGFLRLSSPLAEEPVPLGVAWLFQDVTGAKQTEQEAARLRFRDNQLHRAARAAAECEDPMEAATVHLDFALAGFADHALLDLAVPLSGGPLSAGSPSAPHPSAVQSGEATADGIRDVSRLVRAAVTPAATPGPVPPVEPGVASGIPVGYPEGHPALQAYDRCGSVRASVGVGAEGATVPGWAEARKWPSGTVHGLCAVLRSRGRTLGVATFLRGSSRRPFDRADAAYAEDVAVRVAAAVDLARSLH